MAMQIERYYEENANLGNYESARVGLTIKSDKSINSLEELNQVSSKLLQLAKRLVKEEIAIIKQEKENNNG